MSIYFDPHGHRLHMEQLEDQILNRHYDHFKPQLTGWRAERKAAELEYRRREPIANQAIYRNQRRLAPNAMTQFVRYCLGLKAAG